MPWQVKEEAALEKVVNHKGMVTWRVLPPMSGTIGVKLIALVELAPVMKLLLLREQEVIIDGQNWMVDCPVPNTFDEASLIDTNIF